MTLPPTLLSLVYHSTVPAYRDEMHEDPRHSFERFGITGSVLREVILCADRAAFDLRIGKPNGKDDLMKASADLFGRLAPILAMEIANGVPGPDQPVDGSRGPNAELLEKLYLLVYSAEYRARNPPPPNPDVADAWNNVKAALNAGGGDYDALLSDTVALCARIKLEFDEKVWRIVW